jgi:hypothetical protein
LQSCQHIDVWQYADVGIFLLRNVASPSVRQSRSICAPDLHGRDSGRSVFGAMDITRGRESQLAFAANSDHEGPAAIRCISRALDDADHSEERVFRATPSLIMFADDYAYEPCDRTTLLTVLDTYLGALSRSDPGAVPFASQVRVTEDCVETPIGCGLWCDAPRLGTFRHVVADTARGQVGCMAVLEVGGEPALLTLRLKLEGGRISEAESLLTRRGDAAFFAPENLRSVEPIFDRSLPPEQRAARHELRGLVDRYFDGIERCDASGLKWHPECQRSQNGVRSAQGAAIGEQFGRFSYIQRVDRRYCAFDEERGLVWGIFAFQIPGDPGHAPRTSFIGESFKLMGGRIRAIQAFVRNTPYGTASGW